MSVPHGGKLIRRILPDKEAQAVKQNPGDFPKVKLAEAGVKDVFNICHGVYSPLEGFVTSADFKSVLKHMHLSNDLPWPIPIALDVDKDKASSLNEGSDVLLADENESPIALLHLEEKYSYKKEELAQGIFGTLDTNHPGVAKVMAMEDVLLGGAVDLVSRPDLPFADLTLDPAQTRALFEKNGWRTIVGFQTRNVPHVGHEYLQKTALTFTDGVFVNPVIGKKKKGDFLDQVILDSYKALLKHYYPDGRAAMSILHLEMRYAGPREAIFHAIVRKNFGCTHFIVGRDHAGVGDYYEPFAAQEIFGEFPDLGITPLFFKSFFHCKKCGGVSNDKTCPHSGDEIINFSGTAIREMLIKGEIPPAEMMREEVARAIIKHEKIFVE